MLTEEKPNQTEEAQNNQSSPPSISLPKGGGAIRGIGEKFAANPVTGTGSLSVPIATSPGRSGFGPQLSLTYDSGAGNGSFGFGWNLSLPSITRKTDKGLPKYQDGDESDTFILSGAEDLVPVLKQQGNGWALEELPDRTIGPDTYRIQRYRPRIEGLFARIERWTNTRTNETHWRSITRDNAVAVYGRTTASRIEDPNPPEGSPRVFSWLICESYDDNGNAIYYEYEPEDSAEIDLSQTNERNRTDKIRSANRYLKRIKYGNKTPVEHDSDLPREFRENLSKRTDWLFEVLFDYDEGHYEALPADPDGRQFVNACINPTQDWQRRQDPFSSFRSGFEVRTYRLCHRIFMFHHFPNELGVDDYLVRSTGFKYKENPIASFITSVIQSGFKRQDDGAYLIKSLPPLEFEYSKASIQDKVEDVDEESIENLPQGLDAAQYQWADIDGEGSSGILTEQGDSWLYKRNVSALPVMDEDGNTHTVARFAPAEHLAIIPSFTNLSEGRQQLLDLAGDGQLDLVEFDSPTPGFYERTKDEAWHPFKPFVSLPNISWQDPSLKFVDLTGDGHADIFITVDEAFTWYPSLAETGFACGEKVRQALDEEKGPKLVLADGTQSIYLADISGDGLTDLVRIRNGEVCYWPNLGYGRFGAKVTMDNSPYFDAPDHFDQRRIRLADIDGSGVIDIIYLKDDGVYIYLNESGNRWADAEKLKLFPKIDNLSSVMAVDLLGNGTACLVWSSPLPGDTSMPMRYVNLMGGQKPHLLVSVKNNLGTETDVQYAPSTKFYLADKLAGKPWITRLPFPVHCVEKVTVKDRWRETAFSTQYSYHHGYFDGFEREFQGFGRVEQIDIETYGEFARGNTASPYITDDKTLYQPPVKTITWYHTGAFIDHERIISHYQGEYFPDWLEGAGFSVDPNYAFSERDLPEPDLTDQDLGTEEWRDALRACKGMTLRQEIYELDVDALEDGEYIPVKLFSAAGHNCQIRRVQPKGDNAHVVFLVTESEALTYHYELDLREKILRPDPRITHNLTLSTNKYGQVQQVVAVGYRRAGQFQDTSALLTTEDEALIREVQNELHISYEETRYTEDVELTDHYRLRLPCEVFTFELSGIRPEDHGDRDRYFTLDELRQFDSSEVYPAETEEPIPVGSLSYHEIPDRTNPQKRIIEQVRTLFFSENLNDPLPLGEINHLGLLYEAYTLAFTDDLLDAVFKEKLQTVQEDGEEYAAAVQRILSEGGYHFWEDLWWTRSGIAGFADDAEDHFFLPERYEDPFDQVTELAYDDRDIYIRQSKDPVDNVTSVEKFDFRVLAPAVIKDPNNNFSAVAFDALGLPVASAVIGKNRSESGDNLEDIDTDLAIGDVTAFFTREDYDEDQAANWLGNSTARFVYYFGEQQEGNDTTYENHPACACGIVREKHVNEDANSPIRATFEYSGGMGQVLVTKSQAEPENNDEPMRWIASGKTILNNKGKPVKQYEPYFSSSGHRYEASQEVGVTPVIYYDAVGRVIRTELPDGAYSRVEFSPWFMAAFDPNDTVLEPNNAWHERNSAANASLESRRAANLAADHADTPAVTHMDSLGREVVAVAHNKYRNPGDTLIEEKYITFTKLDAEGKSLWIRDARGNRVMQYITPSVPDGQPRDPSDGYVPCYDLAGNLLFQHSMDAGDRWMLNDVTGQPLFAWDNRTNTLRTTYDALRRPKKLELRNDDHPDWIMVGYTQYGDDEIFDNEDFKSRNLRGQAFRSYDQSGLIATERFDFKGNPLTACRRLAEDYAGDINWQTAENLSSDQEPDNLLMAEAFTQTTEYDALNRVVRQYPWHKGVGSRVNVFEPYYNERSLLKKEDLWLDATKTVTGHENGSKTEVIKGLTHDAKGQRQSITYGNGATTTYNYDENTFRLIHLETQRRADNKTIQDLSYTYDPSGNITEIIDKAQPTVFFNNFQVEAKNQYTYDALYRLIQARGREHAGQVVHGDSDNWHDCFYRNRYHVNDVMTWQNYTERYEYDGVGNILSVQHKTNAGSPNNWMRNYQYEPFSNRLLATGIGNDNIDHYPQIPTLDYGYSYNEHGSMTAMPHLADMAWDITENLHHVTRSAGTQGEGDDPCPYTSIEAWYRYDADKQRTRKRMLKGETVEERFYLGGVEIFRRFNGSGTLILERETLHIMDDTQRIAMVETKTIDTSNDPSPTQLIRYQFGNHLGSASLELDNDGKVISYEEYYPYGNTSYHALDKNIKASAKRYRYTGKERDEETGLYYHGARYYAPWLVRWTAADPAGLVDGPNLYGYVRGSPLMMSDPSGGQSLTPEQVAQLGGISLSEARKLGRPVVQPRGTFEEHVEQPDATPDPFVGLSGTASAGVAARGSGRVQTTLGDKPIVKSFGEHSSFAIPKGQEPSAFEVVPALLTSGITVGPSMVEGVLMGSYNLTTGILEAVEADTDEAQDKAIGRAIAGGVDVALGIFGARSLGKNPKLSKPPPKPAPKPARQLPNTVPQAPVLESATPVGAASPPPSVNPSQFGPFTPAQRQWVREVVGLNRRKSLPKTKPDPFGKTVPDPFAKTEIPHIPGKKNPVQFIKFTQDQLKQIEIWYKKIKGNK